ncbi:unnamed protein product [Phytophthora fragariaefolia]|uniref:Unnamed protein product n=1 Tax=Phytophthora fragariaefolia TaxID=1490495 RepID=A0A9W6XWW3_9STRA|nr:unnamed protein product [Phytophthora fragariaefolia]
MRTMMDRDNVQQFVNAVAATELLPLSSEPHNGRIYSYGGILPGSGEPAVLELPRGIHWLNDMSPAEFEACSSRLYVRPAYQVLLLLAMAFVDHPEAPHHRVVITGSSGTGKTSFINWMLRHLRRFDKPPVIVLEMAGFFGCIASDGTVTAGVRGSSFQQELASRSTVYLCDATWTEDIEYDGSEIRARTIVMSPPMHAVTSRSTADTMRTLVLVMPLWTMAELETCRSTCYLRIVSQETLLELYQLWGGVVRWTLGTSKQESRHEFVRSLESVSFTSMIRIVRNGGLVQLHELDCNDSAAEITIGARLVHMHVDSDSTFQHCGAAVCSPLACSLLIGASSEQLRNAEDFVGRMEHHVDPTNMDIFRHQVQQVLFDRALDTP